MGQKYVYLRLANRAQAHILGPKGRLFVGHLPEEEPEDVALLGTAADVATTSSATWSRELLIRHKPSPAPDAIFAEEPDDFAVVADTDEALHPVYTADNVSQPAVAIRWDNGHKARP